MTPLDAARPTVTVLGTATVRARPDEAHLHLEITKLDRRSEDAHADVAARSASLEALLDELGVPKERRTTAGVSVGPEHEWAGSRWQRKGWRASNRIVVRLHDPAIAGRLIGEAVDRAEAIVNGPWWNVTPGHPARARACADAADQAKRKAQAYATALGLTLGAVTRIREPGTGRGESDAMTRASFAMPAPAAMQVSRGGQPQPPPTIDVEPGEVDVHGAVEVTFSLGSG